MGKTKILIFVCPNFQFVLSITIEYGGSCGRSAKYQFSNQVFVKLVIFFHYNRLLVNYKDTKFQELYQKIDNYLIDYQIIISTYSHVLKNTYIFEAVESILFH